MLKRLEGRAPAGTSHSPPPRIAAFGFDQTMRQCLNQACEQEAYPTSNPPPPISNCTDISRLTTLSDPYAYSIGAPVRVPYCGMRHNEPV